MESYPRHKRTILPIDAGDIIDSHTHCGGVLLGNMLLGSYPYSQDALDLVRKMQANGVRYSICFPFPLSTEFAPIFTPQLYNDLIAKEVYAFGDGSLLPFAFVRLDDTLLSQIRHIENLQNDYRFYGVKIYPPCDKYFICDKNVENNLTSFLSSYDFPIVIHTSFSGFGNSKSLMQYAQKHENIRISLAHAARFDKEVFQSIRNLHNVFIDCSPLNMLCALMRRTIEKSHKTSDFFDFNKPDIVLHQLIEMFPHQLLWGSDSPCSFLTNFSVNAISKFSEKFTYEADLELLRKMSKEEIQLIANINPIRFLFGQ